MPKTIKWRDWEDPFRPVVNDYKDALESGEIEDEEDEDAWRNKNKRKTYKGPVIVGGFGVIPVREETLPSTLWKFYVGDVNFEITPKVYDAIMKTPGVDIFKQWTRYRIWLGVGSNFEPADVQKAVEENAIKASGIERRVRKGLSVSR